MERVSCLALACVLIAPAEVSDARADGMLMAAPKACTIDGARKATMLAAPYDSFDQTMYGGWRPLVDEGCYAVAADIVGQYIEMHRAQLSPEQIWTMNFHVGQALAMGGQDAASVVWFEKSRDARAEPEWLAYVDATLAFLKKDASALASARAAYSIAPHHDLFRLHLIDGFGRCLTKSYNDALMCAPA